MELRSVGTVMHVLNRNGEAALRELLGDRPLRPVQAVMIERRGVCEHADGEVLRFDAPWGEPDRPVCPGLLGVLRAFLGAASAGVPADRNGGDYLVSCPSGKGTVWKVEAVTGSQNSTSI